MKFKSTILKALAVTGVLSLGLSTRSEGQFIGTPGQTAAVLAQTLVGTGVTISNPTMSCATNANGKFVSFNTTLGIDSGVVLTTGNVNTGGGTFGGIGIGNPSGSFASTTNGGASPDPDLASISAVSLNDLCKLEFDFIPTGDTIKFDYKFGSEEYPSFTCTSFNDAFGFFISGPGIVGTQNIALIPNTFTGISINTVNNASCGIAAGGQPYFIPYTAPGTPSTTIVYGGTTTILQAIAQVIPCSTYHLKLAIADGGDSAYDSGVFIKAGSLTSNNVAISAGSGAGLSAYATPTIVQGCAPGSFSFSLSSPVVNTDTFYYGVGGTAVNGVNYGQIPNYVVITAGSSTATIPIQALITGDTTVRTVTLYPLSTTPCAIAGAIDSATITILPPPTVNIILPTQDTGVCENSVVNFVAVGNILGMEYSWTGSNIATNPNDSTISAVPSVSGPFIVTATLPGSGCQPVSDMVNVTVVPKPIAMPASNSPVCNYDSLLFTGNAVAGATYSWTGPNGFTSNLQNPFVAHASTADAGTYTYVIDNNGCVSDPSSTSVIVYPTVTNTDNTLLCPGSTLNYGNLTITAGGIYNDTFQTTLGCDSSVALTVFMPPVNVTPISATICAGGTYDFNGVPYSTTGFYPQVYISAVGCDSTVNLNLVVNPPIIYNITDSICEGTQYFLNGVAYNETGQYTQFYSTPQGCDSSVVLNLIVPADPVVDFALSNDACINNLIPVTVTRFGQADLIYNWNFNDAEVVSGSDSGPYQVRYTTPGTKTITLQGISGVLGCKSDVVVKQIELHLPPTSKITDVSATEVCAGDTVFVQAEHGPNYFYDWEPAQDLLVADLDGGAQIAQQKTGFIKVQITDFYGCVGRDSVLVKTVPCCNVFMPTAFTPNGDGRNDVFRLLSRGEHKLQYFMVMDRWGKKVFETVNPEMGWDGRYNNEPQDMGTYFYVLQYQCLTGQIYSKEGEVILVR